MDILGLDKAAKTATAALPEVNKALDHAEDTVRDVAAELTRAVAASLAVAVPALADGVGQVVGTIQRLEQRIDGGRITVTVPEIKVTVDFSFPLPPA